MGLFLEGPKMIGKSTIIRQHLLASNYKVGGYCVQRMLSEQDEVLGYQLSSTENLNPLTSSYEKTFNNCFIKKVNGKMIQDLSIFENLGTKLLKDAITENYDVILLDEIGGIELLVKDFREKLFELCNKQIKMVGVFKYEKNHQQQEKCSHLMNFDSERKELRTQLENNGYLYQVTTENIVLVNERVRQYITS